MVFVKLDVVAGEFIERAVTEGLLLAEFLSTDNVGVGVIFDFNGIEVRVRPGDAVDAVAAAYRVDVNKYSEVLRAGGGGSPRPKNPIAVRARYTAGVAFDRHLHTYGDTISRLCDEVDRLEGVLSALKGDCADLCFLTAEAIPGDAGSDWTRGCQACGDAVLAYGAREKVPEV
jgi:hypothetical protein